MVITILLIIAAVVWIGCFVALWVVYKNAPRGEETKNGFEYDKKDGTE